MTNTIRCGLVVLLLTIPVAAAPGGEAGVAAPRIIMFYGAPLTHRVYLTDWQENLGFMGAVDEPMGSEEAAGHERPHIDVALFWNEFRWGRFAQDAAALDSLRPEDGQGARLLPAHAELPAAFDYYSAGWQPGLRRISPEGLAILSAHGIPTRLN